MQFEWRVEARDNFEKTKRLESCSAILVSVVEWTWEGRGKEFIKWLPLEKLI